MEEKLILAISVYPELYNMSDRNYQNREREAHLCVCVCLSHAPTSSFLRVCSLEPWLWVHYPIIVVIILKTCEGKDPPYDAHSKKEKDFKQKTAAELCRSHNGYFQDIVVIQTRQTCCVLFSRRTSASSNHSKALHQRFSAWKKHHVDTDPKMRGVRRTWRLRELGCTHLLFGILNVVLIRSKLFLTSQILGMLPHTN